MQNSSSPLCQWLKSVESKRRKDVLHEMTKTLLELKLNEDGIKTAFKQLSNTCQVVLKRCADKDCQKLKEYKNEGDETPRKKLKLEEKSVENLKESNEQNTLPDDLSNSRKKLLKIQPPRKIDNDVKSVRNLLEKNRKLQRTINDSCTGSSSLTNRNTNKLLGSKVEELDNSSSCSWKSVVKPVGRKGERSIDTNRNFSNFNRRKTDDEKNRHQIESLGYENSQSAASEKFTGSFSSNSRDNNQSSEDVGKNSNNPCSSPKERIGSKPIIRLREELNSKLDNLSQSARREPNNKKSKRGGKRIRARLMRKLTYSSGSSKTDNISSAKETEKQKTVGNSFNLSSPPKLTDDISFARLKDLVIQRMLDSKSDSAKVEQGNSSIHALTLPATDGTSAKDSVCGTGQVQNICLEKVVEVIKIESDDDEDFLSLSTSSNCNRFDTIKSKQVSGEISKINTDRLCERKRSNNKIVPEEPEENEKYFPQHQKNIKHQLNISSAPDKYPSPQQLSDSPICSESFSKFYDETFANKQPDSENLEISCVEVGKKEKERPLGLIKVKDPASLGIFVPSGVLPENALSCKNTNIEKKNHSLPYSLDNPPSNESNNVTYNVKTPENSAPCNVTVGNNNISIYLQVGVSDIVKNQLNSNGNINNNCSLNSSANSLETNKRIANFNQECSKACSRLAKIVQMSVDKNSNTSSMERSNSIQNTNTEMNLTNSHNLPHSQTSLVDEIIEGMQNFDHTYTAQRSYNIQKEKRYPSNRATHKLADTSPLGHNQSPQIQLKTYSKQIVDLSMNKNIIDNISQQHFAAVSSSANLPKGASISVSSSNIEKKHHDIPSHTNSQPFNSTVANVIHAPLSTNSYSPIPSANTIKPQSLPVAVSNETQHNIKSRPPIKSLLKGVQSPSSFHSQMSKFEQVNPGNKNLSQQQAIPDCPTDNNTLKSLVDNLNKNLRSEIRLVNVTDMKEQQPLEHSITTINEPQKCISTHSPQENTSTIEQTTNVSTSPHSLLLDELDLAKIENMYQIIQSTINLRHEKEHNMQILGKAPVFDLTMYSKLIKHFDHSQAVMASTFVSLLITLLKKADSNGINRKKVIMLVFVRILEHSFSDNDSVNVCKKIKNCIIDLLDAFKLKMGQCSASLFSDISLVMRLPDEVFDIAIAITCETIVSPINQFYCHRDYDLAKYSDQIQMFIRNSDLVPFLEKCTKYFDLKNTLAKTSVDVLGTSAMKHDKLSGSNSSSLKKQEEKSGSNKGSSLENAVEPKTNSDRNFAILDSSLTKQIKSSTIYSASKIPVSGALFRDPTEPSIADSTRQAIVANSPFKRPVESSNNNSAEIMSQELLPCLEKAVEPRNNSVKNVRVPAQLMKKPIDSSINGSGNKISVASSLLKDPVESLKTNSAEIISNKVSGSPLKNFLESSHNNLLTLENNVGPSNSKIRIVNAPPRQGIQLIDALPLKGRSFNKPKFVLISKDQSKTKTIFVNKTNASVIQNMRKQFTHSNPALITPKPQPLGNPGNLRNSSNNNPSSAIPSETPVGNNHDPLLNKDVDTADLGPIIIDVRSLQDDDNSNFNFDTVEPSSESSKTESSINSHSTKYSCNFHSNEPQVTNKTVETPANLPNSQATNMQQNTAILVTSQAAMNYAIQSKSFDSSKSPTSSDTSSQVSSILGENQVGDITVQKLANQSDSQSLNNSSKIRYQKQILILQKSDIQSKPQSSSEAVEKKQTIFEYPITKIQLNKNKLDSSQLAMKGALQKPVMLNKLANMDVQKSANPDATQIASKSSVRPIDNKATKAITPEVSLAFPENPQVSCSPGLDANKTVNLVKYHTTNNLIVLEPSAIPNKSQATISINLNSKSILKKPGSSSSATIKAVSPGDSNASTGNAIIIEVPSSSSTVVEEATNVPVEESGRVVKAADSVSETIGNTPKPNKDIVEPTVLKHNLPQQLEYSSQHQMQQLKIAQIAKPLNTQSKPATCGSKVISDDIQKTLQDDIRNTLNQRFNDISLSLGYQCLYCERTGVRRKAFVQCSVCKTARYCDAICQRYDWTVHKAECIPFDTE